MSNALSWRLLRSVLLVSACLAVANCSDSGDDADEQVCIPGTTLPCRCSETSMGVQSCGDDGSGYSACDCDDAASRSPPAEAAPTACFEGGDAGSIGCADGRVACCAGSLCIIDANLSFCAATCLANNECASDCCAPLEDASASVCSSAEYCGAAPTSPPGEPQTLTWGTYSLSAIDRVESNLYEARTVGGSLLIETRLCLVLAVFDDGLLVWQGAVSSALQFDNFSQDVCDVTNVYVL